MPNPFVHVELQTQDLEKSKSFYQSLFSWKLEKAHDMDYTMIKVGEGTGPGVGGGMMKCPMPEVPSHWLSYVAVDDVAASAKKAQSLGATILVQPMEVMGEGTLAVFKDPTGAVLGLWQPKKK